MAEFFALPVTKQNILFYEHDDLAVVTRGSADLRVLGAERRDKKLQLFGVLAWGMLEAVGEYSIDGILAALSAALYLELREQPMTEEERAGLKVLSDSPYELATESCRSAPGDLQSCL